MKAAAQAHMRVAAYARVSTDHEEQQTSLAAQVDYYRNMITERPGWEFVKVYVDETPHFIAAELIRRGIKTSRGKDKWNQQTARRMLSNEKYKGDALLQKQFTVDFLQKKVKKNEGEVPQYYVEGNHEAIISPETFDYVQTELDRRLKERHRYSGVSLFSSKIRCGDCGCWYGSKIWHSTDQYRKVIYRCNRKYDNKEKPCQTMHVTEDEVKAAFVSACNQLFAEKAEIIANAQFIRDTLCGTKELETEKSNLESEMSVLVEMTQNIVSENARIAQDQNDYRKRYNELVEKYNKAKKRYEDVTESISAKEAQSTRLAEFIKRLEAQDGILTEFDERLWSCMVEYVTVGRKKEMTVRFKDGTEIQA